MGSALVPPSIPFFDARRQDDDTPTVRVVGQVDLSTRDRLAEVLDDAIRSGHDLVVDCTQVQFIDASGITVLLSAARAVGDGHLRLVGVHGLLARIIDLLDLTHVQPNIIIETRAGPSAR